MLLSSIRSVVIFLLVGLLFLACEKEQPPVPAGKLQISNIRIGTVSLLQSNQSPIPADKPIVISFNAALETGTIMSNLGLLDSGGADVSYTFTLLDNDATISMTPDDGLQEGGTYRIEILNGLKGILGESFEGFSIDFVVANPPLLVRSLMTEGRQLSSSGRNVDVSLTPVFDLAFSHAVDLTALEENTFLIGDKNYALQFTSQTDSTFLIEVDEPLSAFTKVNFLISENIASIINRPFESVSFELYTKVDTTPKFPLISDAELLTLIQEKTFQYFYDFGHPVSGLARERNTSGETVTSGGSGFGIMALIVGVERGFITRTEAVNRWKRIFEFLKTADRFHGAWSHWLNGTTGKVRPFSEKDNGGDLVETAFLVQGMITVRQYLDQNIPAEAELIDLINELWQGVEWDWYTKGEGKYLYWHWSPQFNFEMNLPIRGHNETMITYVLAAASTTYTIDPLLYHDGYARSGNIQNGNLYYDIPLPLGNAFGGPLFFAHYSFLGLDPRNLSDSYANYWQQNVNHSLINRAYCIDNPQNFVGYSEACWGLTASDNDNGYSAHSPTNDRGVITPTAAISSIPYTPEESMEAIRHFYYLLGDRLWGEYGFYDAFNPTAGWTASSYLAIDQGPIICMIENHRTQLLWNLFMSASEVQNGLDKLGFSY
jgi:hypothetical protein